MPSRNMRNLLAGTHNAMFNTAKAMGGYQAGEGNIMMAVEEARGYTEMLASQINSACMANGLQVNCSVTQDGIDEASGTVTFSISLGGVYRPSLNPYKYGGVMDIVLLFTRGYHAHAQVYGEWGGIKYASRTSREGKDIIGSVIESFHAPGLVSKTINPMYVA